LAGEPRARASLWRQPDFLKLWGAQSVSQVGTQVSLLAIPVIAAITLDASPGQMGLIAAAETFPFLLFGLFAGVIVDRMRRRPILIWTDFGRAALLFAIPVGWWLELLSISLLIAVAFLVGTLNVFFDVSYQSYLPALVRRADLVEGNSKLASSQAGAQVAGPGIAGGLIELLGAPVAVIVDAASFLVSGVLLGLIRKEEPEVEAPAGQRSIMRDIGEGLSYIGRHRLLRPIAACTGISNLFGGMAVAVLVLFAARELAITPGLLGLIFGIGSTGFLLGAILAGRVALKLGVGPAIIAAGFVACLGVSIIPLTGGSPLVASATLVVSVFISGFAGAIYNITQVSLRQAITPDRLLGRMNASMRFLVWGTIPLGNLAGGALGELIGLRGTLAVAAAGSLLAPLWPLLSDVRHVRDYADEPLLLEPRAAPAD
jgi:MFS family permease